MFEQDRMLMRLQQQVLGDPAIAVCFLAGSHGRRKEDGYSDLDVALVYRSAAARDEAWERRRAFVQSIMPFVPVKSFDAEHIRPYFYVALYSNGSKVDYRFESQDDFQPNPWDSHLRLLKDTNEWGVKFQQACAREPWPQPQMSVSELEALDNRFWVMYWDALRLLLRGDGQKPFTIYLELLHFSLPPLLRVLPVDGAAHQNLLTAVYDRQTEVTLKHMRRLLGAYLAARAALLRQLNLNFNIDEAFENQMQRLVERHIP